jgi:hypothetical protein
MCRVAATWRTCHGSRRRGWVDGRRVELGLHLLPSGWCVLSIAISTYVAVLVFWQRGGQRLGSIVACCSNTPQRTRTARTV